MPTSSVWPRHSGLIRRLPVPLACYRQHGANAYNSRAGFSEKLAIGVEDFEQQAAFLSRRYRREGLEVDTSVWRHRAWWPRIQASLDEILAIVPQRDALILVDGDASGTNEVLFGRRRFPFAEGFGVSWGLPGDDDEAVAELERLRRQGASFLVFAWSAFWWLEYCHQFDRYCRKSFPCLLENDRLLVYEVSPGRLRHQARPTSSAAMRNNAAARSGWSAAAGAIARRAKLPVPRRRRGRVRT